MNKLGRGALHPFYPVTRPGSHMALGGSPAVSSPLALPHSFLGPVRLVR